MTETLDHEFIEPFSLAACDTLREMAEIEVTFRSITERPFALAARDVAAVVDLGLTPPACMAIVFPESTAINLAQRILAGAARELNDTLVRDCMGEIANVVAGQAKARLAETPFRVALSMPRVIVGPLSPNAPPARKDCPTLAFTSQHGDFTIQFPPGITDR